MKALSTEIKQVEGERQNKLIIFIVYNYSIIGSSSKIEFVPDPIGFSEKVCPYNVSSELGGQWLL